MSRGVFSGGDKIEQALKLYSEGLLTVKAIGQRLGVSDTTVCAWAKKAGLSRPHLYSPHKRKKNK